MTTMMTVDELERRIKDALQQIDRALSTMPPERREVREEIQNDVKQTIKHIDTALHTVRKKVPKKKVRKNTRIRP